MISLKVKQKRIGPVIGRHPWVFSQAFVSIPDGLSHGEPVKLISEKGEFLAYGYFGSYAQITVRIWGYEEDEVLDEKFFIRRIENAHRLRKHYVENIETDSYRLINGENDLLPGLIVDKYSDYLVVQFHTKGMETWKELILRALVKTIQPKGVYERSDLFVRQMENISSPQGKSFDTESLQGTQGVLYGTVPEIITIKENGFNFLVDVIHGQKTGFFLDQRDKRKALIKYTKDASILNCFSYTGGFTIYALSGGANHVINVDTSERALALAKENVKLNGFDINRCTFYEQDVKDFLKNTDRNFDVVILDPPAFIKDRKKRNAGIAGYKSINEMALRILDKDGILVTCSCSANLKMEDFRFLISEVGAKVGKTLRIIETYTHGIDHMQLVPFTEGAYLKCFFISIQR